MMPGVSSSWMLAPLYSMTPGMHVSVVNSYAAMAEAVLVSFVSSVDLPTDGNLWGGALSVRWRREGRSPDERDARVAGLEDVEALALAAPALRALEQRAAHLGQLRLQHPKVVLSRCHPGPPSESDGRAERVRGMPLAGSPLFLCVRAISAWDSE
jgi:hypothetical protein